MTDTGGAARDYVNDIVAALDRLGRAVSGKDREKEGSGQAPEAGTRAFVWKSGEGFRPIRRPALVSPQLLTGIERQARLFFTNVEHFLNGQPAHEVLLWGERGTGKSSLVRSLLVAFADRDIALLEIPESAIRDLPLILDLLEKDPRCWVLYLDDFAFLQPGEHYRELKVLLEGGLEAKPSNTLTVATSNRRHLMREAFPDDNEIHPEETVAETMSLADRFGLSLGFYPFDKQTYLAAVSGHLQALNCTPSGDWQAQALDWAAARGLRSGRTARQAACELAGRTSLADADAEPQRAGTP